MANPTPSNYSCQSGKGVYGGKRSPPSWAPSPGTLNNISYAKGAHPQGLPAVQSQIDPSTQSWNPSAPNIGSWGSGSFYFNSINSYCGAAFTHDQRKIIGIGGGHAAVCVPTPWAFSLETLSWEWLAVPIPSDGFRLSTDAFAANIAAMYPSAQFDTSWGEWLGDYSGWPSGYAQPGKIFPEASHSYNSLCVIPGKDYGNTNGALVDIMPPTGSKTGTDIKTSHLFDLDQGIFIRTPNKPAYSSGNSAGGVVYDELTKKVFFLGSVSSNYKTSIDVMDVKTRTWSVKNSVNQIYLVVDDGGIRLHPPTGLLLYFCSEDINGTPTYVNPIRHRIYAAKISDILADNFTWSILTVNASSWPLNSNGDIQDIGWGYCPINGCFYAINGVNGSTTLWKLSLPADATTANEALSKTWNITTESFSGTQLYSHKQDGSIGDSYVYNRLNWDYLSNSFLWFSNYYESPVQSIRPIGV